MNKITMTFELLEQWITRPGQPGEMLYWANPNREKPDTAAHVYESLGKWEWYAFPPAATQATSMGRELTALAAREAAMRALLMIATGWPVRSGNGGA